jgi:type IV pilus assembly protein PilA
MGKQKGFSLIELLLVVAVILIVAAIAIPSFMRSRMRANEANAVASLRVIHTAAVTYSATYPDIGYPGSLGAMGGASPCTATSSQACLLDDSLSQGVKDGYSFAWNGDGLTPSFNFSLTARPQSVGASGQSMYCTDQSGVIYYEPSGSGCTNASQSLN